MDKYKKKKDSYNLVLLFYGDYYLYIGSPLLYIM